MKMKRGYIIVTLGFFAISLSVHWTYAWLAYLDDVKEHNQPIQFSNYFNGPIVICYFEAIADLTNGMLCLLSYIKLG
jgi:hypothetical protein